MPWLQHYFDVISSLQCYCLYLTHWGRLTHICVSELPIIGSDNGLSPGRRQAIIGTNAGILLIRTLGINLSEFLSEIHTFSFKKMYLKMSSGKRRPVCLGLNVLKKNLWSSVLNCLRLFSAYRLGMLGCHRIKIDGISRNAYSMQNYLLL